MNAALSFTSTLRMALIVALELVADTVHGHDVVGISRIWLHLAAEVLDVRIDRTLVALESVALNAIDQLHPGEDLVRVAGQGLQQAKLGGGQFHAPAAEGHLVRLEVDHEIACPHGLNRLPAAAAQDRANARYDLARTEGLRDVIIGAELQAQELVRLLIPRGQHDD